MIKNFIKNISPKLFSALPINILISLSREKMIFPFYHTVSDTAMPHIKHLYKPKSIAEFKSDIDFFLKYYSPATINEVEKFIANKKRSKKPQFFLSFDDGLRENYEIIAPVLKEKGIQAAFFINSAFVDNKQLFHKYKCSLLIDALLQIYDIKKITDIAKLLGTNNYNIEQITKIIRDLNYSDLETIDKIAKILNVKFNEFLSKNKPYLTTEQILELSSQGFIIGAHSVDHPEFFLIGEKDQKIQIIDSLIFLEKLGIKKRYFAFPFTDYKVKATVFDIFTNGAKNIISFGTAGIKRDMTNLHIQRIPMEDDKLDDAKSRIRKEYSYYLLKSLVGKNKLSRK